MEQTINERIELVYRVSKLRSVRAFAAHIGIAQTSMSDILTGNTDPRSSTLLKILKGVPIISPSWLLTGEGAMLRPNCNLDGTNPRIVQNVFNSQDVAQSAGGNGSASSGETASLGQQLQGVREELAALREQNARLTALNEKLTLKLLEQ